MNRAKRFIKKLTLRQIKIFLESRLVSFPFLALGQNEYQADNNREL